MFLVIECISLCVAVCGHSAKCNGPQSNHDSCSNTVLVALVVCCMETHGYLHED